MSHIVLSDTHWVVLRALTASPATLRDIRALLDHHVPLVATLTALQDLRLARRTVTRWALAPVAVAADGNIGVVIADLGQGETTVHWLAAGRCYSEQTLSINFADPAATVSLLQQAERDMPRCFRRVPISVRQQAEGLVPFPRRSRPTGPPPVTEERTYPCQTKDCDGDDHPFGCLPPSNDPSSDAADSLPRLVAGQIATTLRNVLAAIAEGRGIPYTYCRLPGSQIAEFGEPEWAYRAASEALEPDGEWPEDILQTSWGVTIPIGTAAEVSRTATPDGPYEFEVEYRLAAAAGYDHMQNSRLIAAANFDHVASATDCDEAPSTAAFHPPATAGRLGLRNTKLFRHGWHMEPAGTRVETVDGKLHPPEASGDFQQGAAWAATLVADMYQDKAIEILQAAGLDTLPKLVAAGVALQDRVSLSSVLDEIEIQDRSEAFFARRDAIEVELESALEADPSLTDSQLTAAGRYADDDPELVQAIIRVVRTKRGSHLEGGE